MSEILPSMDELLKRAEAKGRADAVKEFAEWFDKDYEIYQKYYGGYCEVKVSTTLHRYFMQIKEQTDE